jgi:hypothetical protein
MTTSIRDLLAQVRTLQQAAQQQPPDPELAGEARQVIGLASTSLRRLQEHWRPDWNPDKPAAQLVAQLTEACAIVEAGNGPLISHPAQLTAVAGDAVGTLCGQANPAADRWAIAVAIAGTVCDAATSYRVHGPAVLDKAAAVAEQAAVAVLRAGRRYVPGPTTGVLDLPIASPSHLLPHPLARAAAAAAEIDRILALAAVDHTRPAVTVYELRSLALAFHTTTQLTGPRLGISPASAAQAWDDVRQLARGMDDGAKPAPDGPERIVRSCAELHDNLHRWAQSDLPGPDTSPTLREILARVASSAGNIAEQAHRLAGRLYNRADAYPPRETRVTEMLHGQAVIVDAEDLTVLVEAIRVAEIASAELITVGAEVGTGLGDYPVLSAEPLPVAAPISLEPPRI